MNGAIFRADCRCYACGDSFSESFEYREGVIYADSDMECGECGAGSGYTVDEDKWDDDTRWVLYHTKTNTPVGTVAGPIERDAVFNMSAKLERSWDYSELDPEEDYDVRVEHAVDHTSGYRLATGRDLLVSLARDHNAPTELIDQAIALFKRSGLG